MRVFAKDENWFGVSPKVNAAWNSLKAVQNSIAVPDPQYYNLLPGITTSVVGVEEFAVSMNHQLHCLVSPLQFAINIP